MPRILAIIQPYVSYIDNQLHIVLLFIETIYVIRPLFRLRLRETSVKIACRGLLKVV